jgi:hypothetical protein
VLLVDGSRGGAGVDRALADTCCSSIPVFYPAPAEALAQGALWGVERRLQPQAADHDHVAAGGEHACHLVEEDRHADLNDQVQGSVREGQPLGVTDQEFNATRQLVRKLRLRLLDHRLRDVQARDARVRKLSREPQRSRPRSGAEIEGAGGRRVEAGDRGGERRQVLGRVRPHALVPAAGQAVEETGHRPAQQRPRPGGARHHPCERLADDAHRQRRRRTGALRLVAHVATPDQRRRCTAGVIERAAPGGPAGGRVSRERCVHVARCVSDNPWWRLRLRAIRGGDLPKRDGECGGLPNWKPARAPLLPLRARYRSRRRPLPKTPASPLDPSRSTGGIQARVEALNVERRARHGWRSECRGCERARRAAGEPLPPGP